MRKRNPKPSENELWLVRILNSKRRADAKLQRVLRRYVESWLAAGSNCYRWFGRDARLSRRLHKSLNRIWWVVLPDREGRAVLSPQRLGVGVKLDAAWLFARLVTGPFYASLGKCVRCGRYFLDLHLGPKKKFCSRKCATRFTAEETMRKKRQREQERKLARAQAILRQVRPEGDWKRRAARRAGVTLTWLTRNLNAGNLRAPKGGIAE